jgi:hypothetical protein
MNYYHIFASPIHQIEPGLPKKATSKVMEDGVVMMMTYERQGCEYGVAAVLTCEEAEALASSIKANVMQARVVQGERKRARILELETELERLKREGEAALQMKRLSDLWISPEAMAEMRAWMPGPDGEEHRSP